LLNRTSPEHAAAEIVDSYRALADWIGVAPPLFAYPSGGVDDAAADAARRAGIALAFTTRRGHNNLTVCDPLRLRRINVGRATSLPLFRAQLLAQARWLNPCWSA
jgi:peptidoglycan/xylan/chitin deacetylase (PgdA/CDA1 family)